MNFEKAIRECLGDRVLTKEPMSRHTTFRIGGPADYYCMPRSIEELQQVIMLCRNEKLPFRVMGNGSNLLFQDNGYAGVIIDMTKGFQHGTVSGRQLTAEAGVLLGSLAKKAMTNQLTGLEFAAGIPGSVGGALVMNAGAYGGEIKQVVTWAKVLTESGEIRKVSPEELELSYRHSAIRKNGWIVLEAAFTLEQGEEEKIRRQMETFAASRREKQPLEYPSAGSTFKRPEGYFAAQLIDEAGLKGLTVGDAQVSEKHAGFVINRGHALAADVLELCRQVKEKVKNNSGVDLELEVEVID